MNNRLTGYCGNCNSNVVHVRLFQRRFFFMFDRITFGFFGRLGLGPWQCVDCGTRHMTLTPKQKDARSISEQAEAIDPGKPVGNYIRTEHSLAHAASSKTRYSQKFRMGAVEKLLKGKSTVTRTCQELGVGELEIQSWIKDYLQVELNKVSRAAQGALIQTGTTGSQSPEPIDWRGEESSGPVIESTAVRKPR